MKKERKKWTNVNACKFVHVSWSVSQDWSNPILLITRTPENRSVGNLNLNMCVFLSVDIVDFKPSLHDFFLIYRINWSSQFQKNAFSGIEWKEYHTTSNLINFFF